MAKRTKHKRRQIQNQLGLIDRGHLGQDKLAVRVAQGDDVLHFATIRRRRVRTMDSDFDL
jgi:hypothetical protein